MVVKTGRTLLELVMAAVTGDVAAVTGDESQFLVDDSKYLHPPFLFLTPLSFHQHSAGERF